MPSPRSPPNSLLEPSCGFLRVSRGLLRALFGGIRVLLALSWASPAALVGGLQSFLGPFSRPSFKAYRVLTFSLPSGGVKMASRFSRRDLRRSWGSPWAFLGNRGAILRSHRLHRKRQDRKGTRQCSSLHASCFGVVRGGAQGAPRALGTLLERFLGPFGQCGQPPRAILGYRG